MKLILILAVIALAYGLQQQPTIEDADLVVTKFNWSRIRHTSNLIHGVDNPSSSMNEPVTIPGRNVPTNPRNSRTDATWRKDALKWS